MEHFNFDINKCIECKKILNKNAVSRKIYKDECSYSKYIGNCTDLYHKLKPIDYEDFYNKELSFASENINLRVEQRGLTYEEFYELAVKYKTMVEEQTDLGYDLSVYFYSLVCHAIIETFNGQMKEEQIIKLLRLRGYNPQKVKGSKDARYGVDIAVEGISEDFYIQVKPISFFLSNYQDTQDDRISCCEKREEVLKLEKIDTYYMIYNLNDKTGELKWLCKNEDDILFNINDLFQYDKNNIKDTLLRKKVSLFKSIKIF